MILGQRSFDPSITRGSETMEMNLVNERLQPAREILASDGYLLNVAEDDGCLDVVISAGPTACADCLVDEQILKSILEKMLDADGTSGLSLRITYPYSPSK
jgi:hypothetical protein